MTKRPPKYANSLNIFTDPNLYNSYRLANGRLKLSKSDFDKILTCILKTIAYRMVNNIAGVVVKNFGYLFVLMLPEFSTATIFKSKTEKLLLKNFHNRKVHSLCWADITYDQVYSDWIMDRAFTIPVKKSLQKNLQKGWKYKFYYSQVRRLFNKDKNTLTKDVQNGIFK